MDATVEGKQEASVEHMVVERDAHCRYAHELLSQMAYAGHMEAENGAPSKAAKKLRLSGPTTTAFTITAS
uniref:Uncharacterized protein n=1 Tax=Globisporangium ultimum (strain ATCC 200006 / CBS 805.95 / DAOM BR144) TaxID=431595 RepID=K3XBU3_GLOUD